MSYGAKIPDAMRRGSIDVGWISKGGKPAGDSAMGLQRHTQA
jgi:hypothetical protein